MNDDSIIPDPYLTEIGRVAVHWNRMESLQMSLVLLLGKEMEDPRSHTVFIHMSFPQKLDVLSAMVERLILPPAHPLLQYKSDIQPVLKEAERLINAIIHQKWGMNDGTAVRMNTEARGSLEYKRTTVTLK